MWYRGGGGRVGISGRHSPRARQLRPSASGPKATSPKACIVLPAWAPKMSIVCRQKVRCISPDNPFPCQSGGRSATNCYILRPGGIIIGTSSRVAILLSKSTFPLSGCTRAHVLYGVHVRLHIHDTIKSKQHKRDTEVKDDKSRAPCPIPTIGQNKTSRTAPFQAQKWKGAWSV